MGIFKFALNVSRGEILIGQVNPKMKEFIAIWREEGVIEALNFCDKRRKIVWEEV